MSDLTYGEKLVGLNFNPSNNPAVTELKELFAKIVDHCADALAVIDDEDSPHGPIYREAMMRTLDAQMWCVKAATWEG